MRGVVLDLDSLHPQDLDLAALRASLPHWSFFDQTSAAEVNERIADAEVVVSNKVCLSAAQLEAAPAVRLICVAATGTNTIDLAAAARAGIVVSNARDYATASVTEAVFALLLTLVRQLDRYRGQVSSGRWSESRHFCLFDVPIGELYGQTLGIVGYGVLGRAVARCAQAFGMQVIVCQRLQGTPVDGRVSWHELLGTADVVSLHCPLSDATRNLIDTPQFKLMKRSAILINTARGGIVNETALIDALRQGEIAAAGFDVAAEEPATRDSPLLRFSSPQLIVTPHIAWASRNARQRLVGEIVKNIAAFQQGTSRNQVCN